MHVLLKKIINEKPTKISTLYIIYISNIISVAKIHDMNFDDYH